MVEALLKIFNRDLGKLMEEIILFEYDQNLWVSRGDVSNSAGNLCLHLVGNLNHFIGAVIGETGYQKPKVGV